MLPFEGQKCSTGKGHGHGIGLGDPPGPASPAFPSEITACDAAFLNVHGDFGEDG